MTENTLLTQLGSNVLKAKEGNIEALGTPRSTSFGMIATMECYSYLLFMFSIMLFTLTREKVYKE